MGARRRRGASLAVAVIALLAGCRGGPTSFSVRMDDSSMEPTFTARAEVRFRPLERLERGAVVAFEYPFAYPGRPRRALIGRIIGLPGDRIELGPDRLAIDGQTLAEPYAKNRDRMAAQTVVVPPEAYFVLGDDRANQRDSRWWGALPADKLLGVRAAD